MSAEPLLKLVEFEASIAPAEADGYSYYFARSRPKFVERRIARKQEVHLELLRRSLVASGRGEPRRIVEIGPGEGWFARACERADFAAYRGVEATATGAERLTELGFDVEQATVPPLPEQPWPVDLVYASHLIEHLDGADTVRTLLSDARSMLAPGGAIALAFPDARRLGVDFWDCDYTHRWPSTLRRVRQVAEDAGLQVADSWRMCLHLTGVQAAIASRAARLLPHGLLDRLAPAADDRWYRGRMLFAPDILVLLVPRDPER